MKIKNIFITLALVPFLFACNNTPTDPVDDTKIIEFSEKSIYIEPTKSYALEYKFLTDDVTDKKVKFSSDNTSVATVSSNGMVLGKNNGTANIKVTSIATNKSDTCVVNVGPQIDKGELNIPTVDVESLNITLPDKPTRTYSQSDISCDDTYDYINFYEVSDFHGAVNYSVNSSSYNIGLAKMASYFDYLRSLNRGGSVFLSTGDMYQGSVESNLTRGYLVNYAMNYMGFDAMAVGNHEFDWGEDWLRKNAELTYNGDLVPFLGANIFYKNGGSPSYLKKSTVITRGNYKIGIIGTIGSTLESSITKKNVENFDFANEKPIVIEEAARLRNDENCDIVIWLTHNGVDDIEYVDIKKSDGIDAIFGGHAHQSVFRFPVDEEDVPIAATENYGRGIASIKLKINRNTKEVSNSYTTVISSYPNLEDNEAVQSIMNQYASSIDTIKNIKLGHTSMDLDIEGFLANICVDSMQQAANEFIQNNDQGYEKLEIASAYHNVGGGIRADIKRGDITYGDVYTPFPFDNEIVLVKVDGYEAKTNIIASPFSIWGHWKCDNFSSLDSQQNYYYVTSDFLAFSRLNLKDSDVIHTGLIVRDEVAKYIYKANEVDVGNSFLYKANFN